MYSFVLNQLRHDFSLSAFTAGFIAVLVGYASATAIVFQAAVAAGASQAHIESWIWALGIGMGVSTLLLSLWYKRPLIIAWSTPGAALLAVSLTQASMAQAIGIFLFVGLLLTITGLSGIFKQIVKVIPTSLAAAMLAGILVQFGLDIFVSLKSMPGLILFMLATYLISKRLLPRYCIPLVLVVGAVYCALTEALTMENLQFDFATPLFVAPEFSLQLMLGIGLPLYIVTMTSQNLPGVAILKSSGYEAQSVSPLISVSGITTLLFAPFGGFTYNLAAISAAICTSEESHPDPQKRYISGLSQGVFNILAGVFGTAVVSFFAAFPQAFIAALAGLALLSTIGTSLKTALQENHTQDAALITFLFTASGVSLFGIASAFWGILLGLIWLQAKKR